MGRSLAILGVPGVLDGGRGIDWLLRDEFTTDAAAPLASPRTCEPGPGTLTIVDTAPVLSISGGLLVPSGTALATADPQVSTPIMTRNAGLVIQTRLRISSANNSARFGWSAYGLGFGSSSVLYAVVNHAIQSIGTYALDTFYVWSVIQRGTGYFMFVDGVLVWVEPSGTGNVWAGHFSNTSAGRPVPTYDYLRVRQLPAPFDSDYGIAALNVNPGVSGTLYTAVANAIHDLTVTAPNPLANTCELRYRVLDDNNYWTAYFDATGAFKLDSVSGGVATNRISVAAVATAGNTYTIRVICDGTKHNCYTLEGTTWTKRGSEVNVSHQDTQTTVKPVAGVDWTLGRLTSWPRTAAAYAELDKV